MRLVTYLRQGLVSAESLASVKITVDAGVGLVQKILLVRASRVGRRARARADVSGPGSTRSATVVAVAVDTRVHGILDPSAVGAMSAGWVVVSGDACASDACTSDTSSSDTSSSYTSTTVVAVTIDTRVDGVLNPSAVGTVGALWVIVSGDACASSSYTSTVGSVSGVGEGTGASSTVVVGVTSVRRVSGVRIVSSVWDAGSTVVPVTVDTRVNGILSPGSVRSVDALGVVVASGCGVCPCGRVGGVVTSRSGSSMSSLGAVGAFRVIVVLIAVESLLDLVDESRHIGWFGWVVMCVVVCELSGLKIVLRKRYQKVLLLMMREGYKCSQSRAETHSYINEWWMCSAHRRASTMSKIASSRWQFRGECNAFLQAVSSFTRN